MITYYKLIEQFLMSHIAFMPKPRAPEVACLLPFASGREDEDAKGDEANFLAVQAMYKAYLQHCEEIGKPHRAKVYY